MFVSPNLCIYTDGRRDGFIYIHKRKVSTIKNEQFYNRLGLFGIKMLKIVHTFYFQYAFGKTLEIVKNSV